MKIEKLRKTGFATKAIHGGAQTNTHGALCSPIYQTSTFVFDSAEQGGRRFAQEEGGYIYTRLGNPTSREVENKIALLEGGEDCASAASGMGAITSAIWVCVEQGDHIVASNTLYGCTYAFLSQGLSRYGVDVTFVDTRDLASIKKAMRPNTKLIYFETPTNPTLHITDIEEVVKIARGVEGCQVMVDNTFATPYITRPFEFGADIVVHSATKYLNGHGDVIAGFVVGSAEFINKVKMLGIKDLTGATLSPFDAFLINRGLKTLEIRMERHCASAEKVAEFLVSHPAVTKVLYPGLESHPQRALIERQMRLAGGMIAFEVKGGVDAGIRTINNVEMLNVAVSLGDAESLIEHPASMTHCAYTPDELKISGIPEGLVRISVGLEEPEDIIADLKQALDRLL